MKYLNKFVSALFVATLGIMTLASCEGADLYKINAPDWLSEKGGEEDEPEPEEELVGQDRKSTRLNSSHGAKSRMPSSAW